MSEKEIQQLIVLFCDKSENIFRLAQKKILVNMNNIMTRLTRSGQKDKLTLNVGRAKNMGLSVRAIENALTTRKLNVESPFTSLSRVLKSASLSETVIVPIYDGEKINFIGFGDVKKSQIIIN